MNSLIGLFSNGEGGIKSNNKLWNTASERFTLSTHIRYAPDQLRNRWNCLKKEFYQVRKLYRITGVGGNNGSVQAADDIWESIKNGLEFKLFSVNVF